jgi:hypothetical protein
MPKYRIELSDGRKFDIEADSQPSEADVLAALDQDSSPAVTQTSPAAPQRTWGDTAVDLLPAAGATVGGIVGGIGGSVAGLGVGGIPGAVGGATVGGAAGEAYKQLINRWRGAAAPATPSEAATDIAKEAAIQGVTELVVPPALNIVGKTGVQIYRGYLKPSLAGHTLPKAKEIVETALREALPITEAGKARAQALITDLNQQVTQMLARAGGKTIDLHAVAERVRDFAKRKYFVPGRAVENYEAALRVADRIDKHPALGLPPNVSPTRVEVDLPTANLVKQGLYDEIPDTAFGVATGSATKEAQKQGAHELRVGLETNVPTSVAPHGGMPGIAPLNARESKLIDAADAIAHAVAREANQNALVGVKTLAGAAVGAEEYNRTGDPFAAATKALAFRWAASPAVASRAAIVAYRLGKAHHLVPATAVRVALAAIAGS